jgi:hypothetical protein
MDPGIFPWAPLQDAVSSAPRANVPIPRAPRSPAADPNATPISPIRMDQRLASPIQMKAPLAAITSWAQSEFPPLDPPLSVNHARSRELFQSQELVA